MPPSTERRRNPPGSGRAWYSHPIEDSAIPGRTRWGKSIGSSSNDSAATGPRHSFLAAKWKYVENLTRRLESADQTELRQSVFGKNPAADLNERIVRNYVNGLSI